MWEWFQSLTFEAKLALTVCSLSAFGCFVICRVFAFGKPPREVVKWDKNRIQSLRNERADLAAVGEKRVFSEFERRRADELDALLDVEHGKEVR